MKEIIPSLEELISYQEMDSQGLVVSTDDTHSVDSDDDNDKTNNDDKQDIESKSDDISTDEHTTDDDFSGDEGGDDDEGSYEGDNSDTDSGESKSYDDESDDESDGDAASDSATKSSVYQNYYDHLKESGFLLVDDEFEFDGSAEKLEEAFQVSETNKWEALKSKMLEKIPEEGKPLFEYFMAGGKDINEYLATYGELDLESVDVTNVKDQKRVLTEYYKRTSNYPDDKIERMIDKLEALDSLQEDAIEAVEELRELDYTKKEELIRNIQQEAIDREKRIRQERITLQNAIDKSNEISDVRKNKVKAFLFNQIGNGNTITTQYNQVLSQISSNPGHIAQLADILLDYNPDKGFDMKRFEKRGKTEANKTFRDTLDAKLDPSSKMKGRSSSPSKESVNWEELLKQIDG